MYHDNDDDDIDYVLSNKINQSIEITITFWLTGNRTDFVSNAWIVIDVKTSDKEE